MKKNYCLYSTSNYGYHERRYICNHKWPKLALIFYVSIRFQVMCTSRLCTASFFFSNYTYLIYLATDLIYVAPNPLIQDGGFKIEPFSRTIFDVKNN